ncbi:hypothetical protein ACHAWC_008072 [Mediolabrus comicus]
MKMIVQIMILAAVACSIASGFATHQVKSSSARTSLNAVDVVGLDPSVADPNILTAAGAAVAAAFTAAIGLNNKNARSDIVKNPSTPDPTIDVSIPYNAAALLAYNACDKSAKKKVTFDEFQALYEAQMVAEVKVKVQKRNIADVLAEMNSVLEACEKDAAAAKDEVDALFGAKEVEA